MQTSNTKLFSALIVLLGLAAGYVFYSQVIVLNEAPIASPASTGRNDLSNFKNLHIDFSVFDNAAYKALAVYGQVPVSPGVTGKKDIFAP
jgi:hypothetical protein